MDPVNFGFYGPRAGWGNAASQTQYHAGWSDTSGGPQAAYSHGTCYSMGAQRASAGSSSDRFHIRLFWAGSDPYTVGDAHHEDYVIWDPNCRGQHAVDSNGPTGSGFDWGRRELMRKFRDAGHYTTYNWWGNTDNFPQCDGDWAGSDGYRRWVWIDH